MLKLLKKYFWLSTAYKEIPVAELLSSNEALKDFGRLWLERKNDVMMLAAMIEFEYTSEKVYTEAELAAVKNTLAKVVKFLKKAGEEWKIYEENQKKE